MVRAGVMVTAALVAVTAAYAQEKPPVVRTQQSAAVVAKYPPLPIALDTPALASGRTTFTSQAELEAFVGRLAATASPHAVAVTLGTTPGGRKMEALLISKEGAATPEALAARGRPVVLLIGQQHGNEPAGGEASLALAKALADGELTGLLERLSVIVLPRANPDGAAADRRENAAGYDINRDHGLLTQPEVRMIHDLVRRAPPSLVIDAHEFTVGQRWMDRFGLLEASDLLVLSATHPMVAAPVRRLAAEVFEPAIEAAIAKWGLKSFVYHTMSTRGGAASISVGGNAPGIARNAFGLMGAVSFLIETRGVGIGLDSFQRRVATHYVAIKAMLEAAAAHVGDLEAAVAEARRDAAGHAGDLIVGHSVVQKAVQLPMLDPATGVEKALPVQMIETRVVTDVVRRARPAGYVVPPDRAEGIARRLALFGATTCRLTVPVEAAVERYDVLGRAETDRRAINPNAGLSVKVVPDLARLAVGSLYVPLDQPEGTQLALALEPDAPGSLSAAELADGASATGVAIQRIPAAAASAFGGNAVACTAASP